jgi:arginine exporter protein ArgO
MNNGELQLLMFYLLGGIFLLWIAVMALPTFISRNINKKNEKKIRELEELLKQKQQTA